MLCSHFFKGVFLKSRHWKNDIKRLFSETMLQKKKRRKEGSGDETTLIGIITQVAVHTTQFSLNMQSGSSQSFLRDSINFLW